MMTEQELWNDFFTHPSKMGDASLLEQHEQFYKQLKSFQKLVQHSMSRFNVQKLYQMLRILVYDLKHTVNYGKFPSIPRTKIGTFSEMKCRIKSLQDRKLKGLQKESEVNIIHYFERFNQDIEYLQKLKKYFDERIFAILYEYYIQQQWQKVLEHTTKDTKEKVTDESYIHAQLQQIFSEFKRNMEELCDVNSKWQHLLAIGEGVANTEDISVYFDEDSLFEIQSLKEYKNLEPVLRFIPDVFIKCSRSIVLAKSWWTEANKLLEYMPKAIEPETKSFTERFDEINHELSKLRVEITYKHTSVDSLREELRRLITRDKRFTTMSQECQNKEHHKKKICEEYTRNFTQREALVLEMKGVDRASKKYSILSNTVEEVEDDLVVQHDEIELLQFSIDLIQSDLYVELEMRPSIIRFIADTRQNIHDNQERIAELKRQETLLEKELALLKVNHDKMNSEGSEVVFTKLSDSSVSVDQQSEPSKKKKVGIEKKTIYSTRRKAYK